ncbi:AAA family ATPase [Spirosoma lituiforme]
MKISKIRIHNYRAFYPQFDQDDQPKPYEIDVKGKNVLIYGENGAGKTSLFRSLQDFFRSSQPNELIRFSKNHFVPPVPIGTPQHSGKVELIFSDDTQYALTDSINNTSTKQEFIKKGQQAAGFLTYVQLIKTYIAGSQTSKPPELFDLLIDNILRGHLLPPTNNLTIGQSWAQLKVDVNAHRNNKYLNLNPDGSLNCSDFNTGLNILIKGFQGTPENSLKGIEDYVNDWLTKYFKLGLQIEFNLQPVEEVLSANKIRKKRVLSRSLTISPILHNTTIQPNYQDFLNEARLSALAICMFLASLRTYPKDVSRMNVLYLDDVFIGLDMANRLPLLDILRNEFSDYQIFLSTYDRAWFEVAKQVVTGWETVEMYTAEQGTKDKPGYCERPVIVTPSDDHYSKACKYYDAKDYPASANYLRKELEQQIKNRLAEEDVRTYDDKHKTLQWFWDRLVLRYDSQRKPLKEIVKDEFSRCKLTIFNPMSHDALSFPVYRAELDKAFRVTEEIRNLETLRWICVLKQGMLLTYHDEDRNYTLIIKLAGDWWLTSETIKNPLECVKATVQKWTDNNGDYFDYRKDRVLTNEEIIVVKARVDKLDKIFNNIVKSLNLKDVNEILISTQVEGYVLKELLIEANGIITRPSLNFLMR